MAEIAEEQRCKRSDGRGWRCRRPVAEGKGYCEAHIQQALLRQRRQPVPDHLKLDKTKRTPILPKSEQVSDDGVTDAPVRRRKRKTTEASEDVSTSDVRRKTAKKVKHEDSAPVVKNLKMGRMEIAPADSSSSSQHNGGSPAIKVGATPTSTSLRRPIRSKNIEPIPVPVVKSLPAIKENIKADAKENINKKESIKTKIVKRCHWCKLTSFCVLVKCLGCKKNFFCEECINKRLYCKKTVERECPVCQGECPCRACTRGKSKQVKTKETLYDVDEDVSICDSEKEMMVSKRENMSDFEKSQQLHMIRELLPVISKMNHEKIIELDTEARNKGICHGELQVQIAGYSEKECSSSNPEDFKTFD